MKRCIAVALAVMMLALPVVAAPSPPPLPFDILHVTPDAGLSAAFQRTEGWTGADGAHSIALGPDRALWLFGDTFIGDVVDGRRVAPRMIHNSAAWWTRDATPVFRFFAPAHDLLSPERAGEWYWPGDGALHDGHLLLFCMRVRPAPQARFGFDFDWYGCDLLDISNPQAAPEEWRMASRAEAPSRDGILLGAACAVDDAALYAFGVRPDDPTRNLYLARRSHRDGTWRWHVGADGRPEALFPHAAPEMSVTPLLGGWLAVYSPNGLSADVAVRWAARPQGPWSAERIVYRAPEAAQGLLVYGARAHPEIGGRLVLTYNCNAPDEKTLMQRASVYAPRAVRLSLGSVARARISRTAVSGPARQRGQSDPATAPDRHR